MTAGDYDAGAGHPDLETLADLDEGLLEPAADAAARAHVAGCLECADSLRAIGAARAALAALPPEPMPAAVAERLEHALVDAAAGEAGDAEEPRGAVTPRAARFRGRSSPCRAPGPAGAAACSPRVSRPRWCCCWWAA